MKTVKEKRLRKHDKSISVDFFFIFSRFDFWLGGAIWREREEQPVRGYELKKKMEELCSSRKFC